MNVVLFQSHEKRSDGTVVLSDRRAVHMDRVLRVQAGQWVKVGEVGGKLGRGRVVEHSPERTVLRPVLSESPPEPSRVGLVLALPRPKVLRRVLRAATCFGVKRIDLVNSWRVEKSYWQSPVLEAESVNQVLRESLEQAVDTILPEVRLHRFFMEFVGDELPDRTTGGPVFVAHPGASTELPVCLASPCTIILGPEGGFVTREIDRFVDAGAQPARLGERILPVEAAVSAVLGRALKARTVVVQ